MVAATGAFSAPQVDFDNSINLNMPSLVGVPTDGSAMIVALLRHSGSFGSAAAGWTVKLSTSNETSICYKRVAGGESATYTFTCAFGNIFSDARSFVVTGIPTTGDPFDVTPVNPAQVDGTISTATSLTTVSANTLLVLSDAHNNASATTSVAPSGMTTRGGNPTTFHVFDQVQAAAGATGNKQHTTTGIVRHMVAFMAIKSGNAAHTVTSDLVGDGVVSRALATTMTEDVTGDGVVTRLVAGAMSESVTGDGVVSRQVAAAMSEDMTGDGTITRSLLVIPVGRDLTGDGVLTESEGAAYGRSFDLVGDGVLDATKATVAAKSFDLTGDGVLTESHAGALSRSFDLTGDGVISGSADIPFPDIPQCAPDWSPNDGLKSIAGDVFFHEPPNEGDPVIGADVCLIRDSDGLRVDCTTTDGAGHYEFPRDSNDPYTYHVEVRYLDQQGLSEGGCVPV